MGNVLYRPEWSVTYVPYMGKGCIPVSSVMGWALPHFFLDKLV